MQTPAATPVQSAFRVVVSAEILPGHDPSAVRRRVGEAFHLDEARLAALFSGRKVAVRKGVSEDEALRYVARLAGLGLRAELQRETGPAPTPIAATPASVTAPVAPSGGPAPELFALAALPEPASVPASVPAPALELAEDEMNCPKCGERQPRRTLCRACATDMPRYLAAQAQAEQERSDAAAGERVAGRADETAAEVTELVTPPGAWGFDLHHRMGRRTYFTGGWLPTVAICLGGVLALQLGSLAPLALMLLGLYLGLRLMVLRLHDLDFSGWLLLLSLIPLVNALFLLALYVLPGSQGDNRYGPKPRSGSWLGVGVALGVSILCSALLQGTLSSERSAQRLAEAIGAAQQDEGGAPTGFSLETAADSDAPFAYADDNEVVMYSIANCEACDARREWLEYNGVRYTEHFVDQDQSAAEALGDKLGEHSNTQLPVLEVNGELLANDPDSEEIHVRLRPAPEA